jgi:hypothetical protein
LLISLLCIGIQATTLQGMIFHNFAVWLTKKLPMYVCKPLFACHVCMSSVWTMIFWLFFHSYFSCLLLPFIMLVAAGFSSIFTYFIAHNLDDYDFEEYFEK